MSTEDRRAPGAARIPFDGLVEVGGSLGPSFEAQGVNVSEEGMHLRTAYLPELGQQITCRFESAPGQSVITSGEVLWARGADTGGEFGIRFTEMDAESVEALKRVCGFNGGGAQGQAGGKVRLYIEGLASPMRAKIRDAHPTAITVASDLGFLQVGKQLELEDAQSGHKRPASIDRVDVAIDPTSHIPQLVVTLRYEDVPEPAAGTTEITGPARSRPDLHVNDAPADMGAPDDLAALDAASTRMKGAFARQAARVGPAIERFAHRAKVTMSLLASRRRLDDDVGRRRTTAPPLGGGLHASGRKVVRGETGTAAVDDVAAGSKSTRRKAALATAVMVTAIVGALAVKRSHHDGAPAGSANAAPTAETAASVATPSPSSPATAQVESAPTAAAMPLGVVGVQNEKSGAPAGSSNDRSGAASGASDKHLTAGGEDATDAHGAAHKKHAKLAPFGNGPVHHGNMLHLRMDGPVEAIEGAQLPTGFVVKIPGRRSLEAAGPLSARDSRIATIKVGNEPNGAELSVTFKDGVPNYQVSAKGETLVIALAPEGPLETTVAKREDKGVKHGTRGRTDKSDKDTRPER